jgi:hypothetical protein
MWDQLMDDVHASMHFYGRAPDHHPPIWFLKIEVGPSFMGVGPAVVFLSQPGRQAAISPAGLLAVTPSWGTIVTPVQAVFVSVSWLPILIIEVAGVIASLVVFASFVVVICQQGRSVQDQRCPEDAYCKKAFPHVPSAVSDAITVPDHPPYEFAVQLNESRLAESSHWTGVLAAS